MTGLVDTISGKTARLAAAAQERQASLLSDEKRKVEQVAAGQAQAMQTGGGGLLAYVDESVKKLRKTFGA